MKGVDISQSATGMVRSYGDAAQSEAMARARKFESANGRQDAQIWNAIAHLIHQGAHFRNVERKPDADSADQQTPPA